MDEATSQSICTARPATGRATRAKRGARERWQLEAIGGPDGPAVGRDAMAGVWYVVAHLSIRDQAWVLLEPDHAIAPSTCRSTSRRQTTWARSRSFPVTAERAGDEGPAGPRLERAGRQNRSTSASPMGRTRRVQLLGVGRRRRRERGRPRASATWWPTTRTAPGRWVASADVVENYAHAHGRTPTPREQMGLQRMVHQANPAGCCVLALLVFPITFVRHQLPLARAAQGAGDRPVVPPGVRTEHGRQLLEHLHPRLHRRRRDQGAVQVSKLTPAPHPGRDVAS